MIGQTTQRPTNMTAASVLISVFEFLERANQTNHQKVDMFTSQRTFVKKKKKNDSRPTQLPSRGCT